MSYFTNLYVSPKFNESLWKVVLRHKNNGLGMRRSNAVTINLFVSLTNEPENSHFSLFHELFVMAWLIFYWK